MKRIGLVIKMSNPEAVKLGCEVSEWLAVRGAEACVDEATGAAVMPARKAGTEELAGIIDAMVVLGGDGMMLSAARLINGRKVPILGINMGGLGFLTASTVHELYPLLERLISGDYTLEERMMLTVSLTRGGQTTSTHKVLNDAVIKGGNGRLARLETRINKQYVTTYRADGLIVATPTGSTAYSLSANGPILYPTIDSIIVAPICPFNLTNRPVVIPDWMTVDITVSPEQSSLQLILDGQVDIYLGSGDRIDIKRADTNVYLVKYEGKSYFDILRERLMWEVKPVKA